MRCWDCCSWKPFWPGDLDITHHERHLPNWMERGSASTPAPARAWSGGWTPLALAALGDVAGAPLLAVVIVAAIYLRESRQASGRYRARAGGYAAGASSLVLLDDRPTGHRRFERTGLPYVAVLVDDSLSMTIVDRYEPQVAQGPANRGSHGPAWRRRAEPLEPGQDAADRARRRHAVRALPKDYKLRVYFLTGIRPSGGRTRPASPRN